MKFRDLSALTIGTVTGSAAAITPDGVASIESVLASAAAAAAVYLVNALFRWVGAKLSQK